MVLTDDIFFIILEIFMIKVKKKINVNSRKDFGKKIIFAKIIRKKS